MNRQGAAIWSNPSFSVVIPALDMAHVLINTIPQVVHQTVHPHEIIVVDNGSTDGTPSMLQNRFPEVRVVKEDRRGVGVARNTGIRAAEGDYIAFMDADDFWTRRHLAVLKQSAVRHPDAALLATSAGRSRRPLEELTNPGAVMQMRLKGTPAFRPRPRPKQVDLFALRARRGTSITSSSIAVRRSHLLLHDIWFQELDFDEDQIFWHELALSGSVVRSTERTVFIAKHASSASSVLRGRQERSIVVDCRGYEMMPAIRHLRELRPSLSAENQDVIDRYIDGVVTRSWRSTLYLGLQGCAKAARAELRFPRAPAALWFSLVAALPGPVAKALAKSLQCLRPISKHGIPLSPFLSWVDTD